MALGLGTILRPCPSWFAVLCFAVGGLCIAFEVVAAALARRRREPEPVEAPEQIGARLYSSTTQPLTVTITFTMPPKRREVYMRLAAKQKGVSQERFFAEAIGPVMIRAVDDYLERHE
jgi:hypothetical protein